VLPATPMQITRDLQSVELAQSLAAGARQAHDLVPAEIGVS